MRFLLSALILGLAPATLFAADPPTVRIDLGRRVVVEGKWAIDVVPFAAEQGQFRFEPHLVKAIRLGSPGGDTIEVEGIDHRLRGTLQVAEFKVGDRTVPRAEVLSLKRLRVGPPNILGDIVVPLLTLTAMEIVLGIDNVIFLAIVAGKLPKEQQPKARRLGLLGALVTRLILLTTLSYILGLVTPVFTFPDMPFLHEREAREVSWRDIILLAGGLFLIAKSTLEIHAKLHKQQEEHVRAGRSARFGLVLIEIAIIDIVFSLDSVITAVGMVDSLWVMVVAMLIAVAVMMVFAERISKFVARHPTLKILALSFLILIGVLLVAEGLGQHIDKGYVYFAMAFAVIVEGVNLQLRRHSEAISLANSDLPPAGMS